MESSNLSLIDLQCKKILENLLKARYLRLILPWLAEAPKAKKTELLKLHRIISNEKETLEPHTKKEFLSTYQPFYNRKGAQALRHHHDIGVTKTDALYQWETRHFALKDQSYYHYLQPGAVTRIESYKSSIVNERDFFPFHEIFCSFPLLAARIQNLLKNSSTRRASVYRLWDEERKEGRSMVGSTQIKTNIVEAPPFPYRNRASIEPPGPYKTHIYFPLVDTNFETSYRRSFERHEMNPISLYDPPAGI